ncbi:MAG: hypothetical protein M3Q44_03915 [bacterium]|nr:hypothetical protein [bacterium]
MGLLDRLRQKEQEDAERGHQSPLQQRSTERGRVNLRQTIASRQISDEDREAYRQRFGKYPEEE